MDKGEFVKKTVRIAPAINGGYIVTPVGGQYEMTGPESSLAFTDYIDLLAFLNEDYAMANRWPEQPPSSEKGTDQ